VGRAHLWYNARRMTAVTRSVCLGASGSAWLLTISGGIAILLVKDPGTWEGARS